MSVVGGALDERTQLPAFRPDRAPEGRLTLEFIGSGLIWVALAYAFLICVNLATLAVGPAAVLADLDANPAGALLAPLVFDSWGTIGALAGSVLLFAPLLFGTPPSQRRTVSLFFVTASICISELAAALWDFSYRVNGPYASGASGFAIAALGVMFSLSILGLVRLGRQDTRGLGAISSHWWYSFAMIYLCLILTSLWFVIFLQPILAPTVQFNWRVHEFAFIMGLAAPAVLAMRRWSGLGLDGVVRIDVTLANFHFDDLRGRFGQALPKCHVAFKRLEGGEAAEFHPAQTEIWVSDRFEGCLYRERGPEFERGLLHAMVHAELFMEGGPWEPGHMADTTRFNEIASLVGAPPEA